MPRPASPSFLAGVIEGFYGPPWAQSERLELFDGMAAAGLNTYFYCPKDDAKQRAVWREPYTAAEASTLAELIRACSQRGIRFLYAVSPGLDLRYGHDADLESLRRRFAQMLDLGAEHFALLFDDIPDRMDPADLARWGSLARAQCQVANTVRTWLRERRPEGRFLFCPTPYCSRMAAARLGGEGYLEAVGEHLLPDIDVLWTGPEIISPEITVEHARELGRILRRKPLIWDNLHANDYDARRFYCGPYSGRPPGLRDHVAGILTNPNCEFPLNHVAVHTLGAYLQAGESWDPRAAYLDALRAWLPRFATSGSVPVAFDDLVLLGDCFYLPYAFGPAAQALFDRIRSLLARPAGSWGPEAAEVRAQAARLRDVCARMAELRDRSLFWALNRRIWELREEMDLLEKFIGFRIAHPDPARGFGSDFHLPGTYQGGFVARLQRLLVQRPNGDFIPAPPEPAA